ncbi:MAG: response regulator [Chloroflexota bacterium]
MSRILIVEDNLDLRTLLYDALLDAELEVRAAADGAEALAIADEWQPDAIVLDLMMPNMDGTAFLRERKARPQLEHVPVLVLTAHPYHHRLLDGLDVNLVLRKPYDLNELLTAIEIMSAGESGHEHAC